MATRSRMKVCTYCQKTFVKTEHLLRHERSHTGDKPYQCQTCGRRYARRDVLLRHEKVFHGPSNPPAARRGSMASAIGPGKETNTTHDNSGAANAMNSNSSPPFEMRMDRTGHPIPPNPHHQSFHEGSNSMDMQMLGTADLDALATASTMQAQQENFAMSSDTGMHSIAHMIDPALSSTPRSIDAGMRAGHRTGSFTSNTGEASSHMPPRAHDTREWFPQPRTPLGHMALKLTSDPNPKGSVVAMETRSLDGAFDDVYHNNDNMFHGIDFADFGTEGSLPMLEGSGYLDTNLDRASNIPLERFALVARLWPNNKSRLAEQHHKSSIWKEVADFAGDNILTDTSLSKTSPQPSCDRENEFEWGALDEEKRRGLLHALAGTGSLRYGPETEASFPSLKLLNLSLNAVFRQASTLLPFIHQPTFSAKLAPSSIVMPLCLLGMLLLDSGQARAVAARCLPGVTQACCQQLSTASNGRGNGAKTVALLVSGAILLRAWAICPAQNQQQEMLTQKLHMQVMLLATNSRLFSQSEDARRAEDILAQVKGAAATPPNDDGMWKAWARIESVKRLVSSLITTDCWWSYSLGHCPMLRADQTRFDQPCATELYRASSAKVWQRLINASDSGGFSEHMNNSSFNSQSPKQERLSPVGIVGSLSTIWLRILQAQDHRSAGASGESTPFPNTYFRRPLLIQEGPGREIARMLVDEYVLHASDFRFRNPNCAALWHFLNINIYSDLEIFNKAAGRDGADDAHEALQSIASWSRTAEARRACLHAAGIHAAMNRRRAKDGVMLPTELCIFSAALVLGLYVFMMASDVDNAINDGHAVSRVDDDEPFELFEDVSWPISSDDNNFGGSGQSHAVTATGHQQNLAAERFVREGGTISFLGVLCDGGYNAAKRILLDYAGLLEEVSKSDTSGLCRILRIMSDSLLEV